MADRADLEPALGVKSSRSFNHAVDDSGESAADGGGMKLWRQFVSERHGGEEMKRAEAVSAGAADNRERAFRRNHVLLDDGVAAGAGEDFGIHFSERILLIRADFYDGEEERMNDVAVVIIPVEFMAIAISAIAEIPLFVTLERVLDALSIAVAGELPECGLNDGGKKQPIIFARLDRARGLERGNEVRALLRREAVPSLMRRTQETKGEEGGIHERLTAMGEIEVVRGFGIRRIRERLNREINVPGAESAFRGIIRPEFEPRRDAGERATESLERGVIGRVTFPLVLREILLETVRGQRGENGTSDVGEGLHGEGAVRGASIRLAKGGEREQ